MKRCTTFSGVRGLDQLDHERPASRSNTGSVEAGGRRTPGAMPQAAGEAAAGPELERDELARLHGERGRDAVEPDEPGDHDSRLRGRVGEEQLERLRDAVRPQGDGADRPRRSVGSVRVNRSRRFTMASSDTGTRRW